MSTNYLVVQSQRDLATAQNNELQAILAYRKALVEFERQTRAPLHDSVRAGIVGGRNVFDAAVLIELIAQVRGAQLNIQTWLE